MARQASSMWRRVIRGIGGQVAGAGETGNLSHQPSGKKAGGTFSCGHPAVSVKQRLRRAPPAHP